MTKKIDPKYTSLIIPARWYGGGKGLDQFRDDMLSDKHIVKLHDYVNSNDCFPSVEIKGGLCYFLRDSTQESLCQIFTHNNGTTQQKERYLKTEGCDVFMRFGESISIFEKVTEHLSTSLEPYVSTQKPFGLRTFVRGSKKPFTNSVKMYENGGVGYISRDDVEKNDTLIDQHKIFISRAYGAGEGFPHQIIGRPIVGEPGTCCTETYVLIGPFESDKITQNVGKYIHTKFLRFMVMLKKNSQQLPSTVFSFVPLQDFTSSSDIDWSKSISEIDQQLYDKYDLSTDEIAFIEKMIKPME